MFSFLQHRGIIAVTLFSLMSIWAIVFHGLQQAQLGAQLVSGPGSCYFNGNYVICNCQAGGTCTYSNIGSGGPYGIYCGGSGGSPYTSITFGPSSDACANNQIVNMGCANGELAPACIAAKQCIVHPGYSWNGNQNVFGYVGDGVIVPQYGMSAYGCLTSTHCDTNNLTATISCPLPAQACSVDSDCPASGNSCRPNKCIGGTCQLQDVPDGSDLCDTLPANDCNKQKCYTGSCKKRQDCSCFVAAGDFTRMNNIASLVDLSFNRPASLLAAGSCTNNDSTSCNFADSCGKVEYTNTWSGPGCCDGGGSTTMILTADPGQNYATLDFHDACNGQGTGNKQIPVCPCGGSSSSASSQSSPSSRSSASSSRSSSSVSSQSSSSSSSVSSTSSQSSASSRSSSSSVRCTTRGHACADCTTRNICVTCPNAGPHDACTLSCVNFITTSRFPDGASCVPCTVNQVLNEAPLCPGSASSSSGGSSQSSASSSSSTSSQSSGSSSVSSASSASSRSSSASSYSSSRSSLSSSSSSASSASSTSSRSSSSQSSVSSGSSASSSSQSSSNSSSSASSGSSQSSSRSSSSSSSSSAGGYCCIGPFCGGPLYGCTLQSCQLCPQPSSSSASNSNSSASSASSASSSSRSSTSSGGSSVSSTDIFVNNCDPAACENPEAQAFCVSVDRPFCTPINDLPCISCSGTPPSSSSKNSCLHICGNGTRECAEECDDGNTKNNDGCNGSCLIEGGECGDGIIESLLGETCEPALTDPSSDCHAQTCRLNPSSHSSLRSIICGNNRREGTEECDDGPLNGGRNSMCSTACRFTRAACGDNVVQKRFGEDCEPSLVSKNAPFACDAQCHFLYSPQQSSASLVATNDLPGMCSGTECALGGSEFCGLQDASCVGDAALPCILCVPNDPGISTFRPDARLRFTSAASSKKSSSASSAAPIANTNCGNGRFDPGEQCDEGLINSMRPNAFCRPDCTFGRCGDGIVDTPLETCDDGSQNGLEISSCTTLCRRVSDTTVLPAMVIDLPFMPTNGNTALQGQVTGSFDITTGSTTQPPATTATGPATLVIMAAGAAAGYAWRRRRR